jgi:hypothetical protein
MNKYAKACVYLALYWLVFIITPFLFAINIGEESTLYNYVTAFFMFILFVSPFFFLLPYKLSSFSTTRQRVIYIVVGLILPYVAIYLDAIYAITHLKIGLF